MDDRTRRARHLIGSKWSPWVIVVLLALLVSTFEAAGAILLFALLGLMTGAEGALSLPLIGDIRPLLPRVDDTTLYLGAAAAIAVFFIVRGLVTIAQTYAQTRVTENAGARLASKLHRGYLAMPYSARGERNTAEQIRNAHDTVQRFVDGLFLPIVMIVSEAVLVLVLLTVLVVTAPLATLLVIVIVGPVVLVLNRAVHPHLRRLGRDMQTLSTESLKVLRESLEGLDDIRVLGRERYFTHRFAAIRRGLARSRYLKETLGRLPAVGLETGLVLFVAAFLALTVLVGDEALDVLPVLGLFGYIGLRLLPTLERLVVYGNALRFAGPAVDDIYEDVRRVEPWVPDDAEQESPDPLGIEDAITLRDVTFHYPHGADAALRNVDLVIPAGSFVGIVGPTGGGKTTLMEMVIGLRRPSAGSVLVDGVDIHDCLPAWFQSIGVVAQSVFLLDDTIRGNIALGVEDDEIDDDRIAVCVEIAQLDDLVAELPDGLETRIGEQGMRLSGGQRQRIAIARALYRDPEVVIFDEGTSALDSVTESALMSSIDAMRGDRTMLIVAHRLASIAGCDEIHVVSGGRVVASGTYEDLLRESADFRQLAEASDRQ